MRAFLLALILFTTASARADFAEDEYPEQPDILARVVVAAEKEGRFQSKVEEGMTFYLRQAAYIGPLRAPNGIVHVAQLFYIRSAPKGAKNPARGHTFTVFLDGKFKIRDYWEIDGPDINLHVGDRKLLAGDTVIFDYSHPPKNGTVLYDGKVLSFPEWK